MSPSKLLAIVAVLALTIPSGAARAGGGFAGGPPMGMGGLPPGIGGPAMGIGGPPAGIGGPPPGIANGPPAGIGGLGPPPAPPGLSSTAKAVGRIVSPPGIAISAAARALQRDPVGRPSDAAVLTRALAHDERGNEIVRGELVAVSPSAADLAAARRLHFTVLRQERLASLGLLSVTLRVPDGMTAIAALAALQRADRAGNFDYAHVYNPAGEARRPAAAGVPQAFANAGDVTIGMIDGGIDTHHRALQRAGIVVRNFADRAVSPATLHGTAIASLLVGQDSEFCGNLPGARLYAADVYGGTADGGSAEDIARALDWMAANGLAVTNISLAGPPNALLAAAVRAFVAGGHVLVAAAGNDGPAGPPNYPAAYPGVVSVTSVDAHGHFQLDANRARARFAALGVDVRAANLPDGYADYTGTSYASPVVAARFALLLRKPDLRQARTAQDRLARVSSPIAGAGAPLYLVSGAGGTTSAAAH
ncbi:MAG: S8 family serine peptidase [Alphaproteobacteria bacterium]|nr:S8 family serine peptidase [Alphaproteobacteria bacterium]MDE2350853.1 S8 family serine peptidase [Alphaproteobacteria bacterium]